MKNEWYRYLHRCIVWDGCLSNSLWNQNWLTHKMTCTYLISPSALYLILLSSNSPGDLTVQVVPGEKNLPAKCITVYTFSAHESISWFCEEDITWCILHIAWASRVKHLQDVNENYADCTYSRHSCQNVHLLLLWWYILLSHRSRRAELKASLQTVNQPRKGQ